MTLPKTHAWAAVARRTPATRGSSEDVRSGAGVFVYFRAKFSCNRRKVRRRKGQLSLAQVAAPRHYKAGNSIDTPARVVYPSGVGSALPAGPAAPSLRGRSMGLARQASGTATSRRSARGRALLLWKERAAAFNSSCWDGDCRPALLRTSFAIRVRRDRSSVFAWSSRL